MAVQSDISSITYTGNNSTTTSYSVPFVFQENSHLAAIAKVTSTGVESVVTLTNHTGAGDANGGTVRTAVAVPATSTLTIYRTVPATQTTTYQEGGDFPAASHERALDKLTMLGQQNARRSDRSIRVTEADGSRNDMVAVPNSIVGLDGSKQPKAMTVEELKTMIGMTGTTLSVPAGMKTFADSGARSIAVPDFSGQLGSQRDTQDIYIATGTTAGAWAIVDENLSLSDIAANFFTADATGRGKFSSGFVNTGLIEDNAVASAKIASSAVTTAKVADGNITSAKLETIGTVTAGSYGSSASIPVITVNDKGLITAASSASLPVAGVSKFYEPKSGEQGYQPFNGASIFLDTNNSLRVAGTNVEGRFGVGTENLATNGPSFLTVPWTPTETGETISKFWVTHANVFVLGSTGRLYGVGRNASGQLGNGGTTEQSVFIRIGTLTNIVDFCPSGAGLSGVVSCLACTSSGQLWAWGANSQGQLGLNNTTATITTPTQVTANGISSLSISKVYTFGSSQPHSLVITSTNDIYATGYNGFGQLGLGDTNNRQVFNQIPTLKADAVFGHAALESTYLRASTWILRGGELWATGSNVAGTLGVGDTTDRNLFTKLSISGVASLSVSNGYVNEGCGVAALMTDKSIRVWGNNNQGQIGLGATTSQTTPTTPSGISGVTFSKLQFIGSAGAGCNFFALSEAGDLWVTGYQGRVFGRGIGVSTNQTTLQRALRPTSVVWNDFCVFGTGAAATTVLAKTTTGQLWAWGTNTNFECGVGGGSQISVPQRVPII